MIGATHRSAEVRRLRRHRHRSWRMRASVLMLLALGTGSWFVEDFGARELLSLRRMVNLRSFIGQLVPYPLQSAPFDAAVLFHWISDITLSRGLEAAGNTLAISVAAIFLAGIAGACLSVMGATTLMCESPFLPSTRRGAAGWARLGWLTTVAGTRGLMILARSVPEYVWAFLFLAMLGPIAWPLVLALALHNTGILGRLGAEVVENTTPEPMAALRALGATRTQIISSALYPIAFSRFLLFFLYRWETCVREATVLGMLGISSLGFWIQDARARNHYDEMFYFILVGGLLVLIGDLVSAATREWVRRHG